MLALLGPPASGARTLGCIVEALGARSRRSEQGFLADSAFNRAVVELNDAVLEHLGGTWERPPAMPTGWEREPGVDELRRRAGELIAEQVEDGEPLIFVDPRLSFTLPMWRGLIPNWRSLVVMRNPADAASSLLRREARTQTWESAVALWLQYAAQALKNTTIGDGERTVVFYEDLFRDRSRMLARVAGVAGVKLEQVPATVHESTDGLLEVEAPRDLRTAEAVAGDGELPVEARAFYLILRSADLLAAVREFGQGELVARAEPRIEDGLARFAPSLSAALDERRTLRLASEDAALARRECDAARGAERAYRADLDRVRAELEAAVEMQEAPLREAEEQLRIATQRFEKRERLLKRELRNERKKLQSLESSVSWRITRPLRAGKALLTARRRTNGAAGGTKSSSR